MYDMFAPKAVRVGLGNQEPVLNWKVERNRDSLIDLSVLVIVIVIILTYTLLPSILPDMYKSEHVGSVYIMAYWN